MSVRIVACETQTPPHHRSTAEISPYLKMWLHDQEDRYVRKAVKIFEGAGIDTRYSIMSAEEVFQKTSFAEKNQVYAKGAIELGTAVLQKALAKANWKAQDVDYLITVSCTGIMIPSLDAYLINALSMRQDVYRLPVTEMGCVAGVSAIIYAHQFLSAHPGKKAAIVAYESPTSTYQLEDYSMTNIVSAAIFGDGAACTLMSSEPDSQGPKVVGGDMYHFYNATRMMGFDLTDNGLQMVLDQTVPDQISNHFSDIVHPFLEKYNSSIEQVDHLIFHPGGKKIVQTVEQLFGHLGKNINHTKEVLRQYGNMSSATVLYVLAKFLADQPTSGEQGLMLSFGPGFTAQRVLLEW
ncbi:MAG: 3-oxoacyl-[acyl-carrier-protein] synthase III C-terminal domain-containing protein [Bacteroidota bacterium]